MHAAAEAYRKMMQQMRRGSIRPRWRKCGDVVVPSNGAPEHRKVLIQRSIDPAAVCWPDGERYLKAAVVDAYIHYTKWRRASEMLLEFAPSPARSARPDRSLVTNEP